MTKRTRLFLSGAVAALVLFLTLLLLVLCIDIGAVGPQGSKIGLSGLNSAVFSALGTSSLWFSATEWVIWLAIAIAALFAALGVYQIVKRRSLRLVDRRLFVLGGLYAAVIFCFIVFEIFPVNFRPVLTEGELEASFPSSHVLIALPILLSAADEVNRRIRCLPLRVALVSLILLIVIMLPIGRLLSGVHWFTDIVGGALLALALTLGYFAARSHIKA